MFTTLTTVAVTIITTIGSPVSILDRIVEIVRAFFGA